MPDWCSIDLPDAWPDRLRLRTPRGLWRFARGVLGRDRHRVQIPEGLPGGDELPKYLLQEFHNLPNGNYSKRFTRGYITGFDRVMLGRMRRARQRIAEALGGCRAVLDVGSAGGRTAEMLRRAGVPEVWGLDASPYLLQHAAREFPGVRFVQGVAEQTGFPDQRFDGVAACFLLHEIPPRHIDRCLREFHRILQPGGLLAICEPSALQLQQPVRRLLRRGGIGALYFRWLARFVHEPFLDAWHRSNAGAMLAAAGFELIADEQDLPVRHLLARKC